MSLDNVWSELALESGGRILYLVLDGIGGLPVREKGGTELQAARTPNLDRLAAESACGMLDIVGPGITPGSGPGHLALFGYDPLKFLVGRGALSALGIDFDLREGDVAARINFATINRQGEVVDRRAGRIDTEVNRRLCRKIRESVSLDFEGEFFLETVSEHRAVLVLRGADLGGRLHDTDPQKTGVAPKDPDNGDPGSAQTVRLVRSLLQQVREILAQEEKANMILLRGFEKYHPLPSLRQRFRLDGVCVAQYPMYRGISRLIGMSVARPPESLEASFDSMQRQFAESFDFFFLHVKKTDSSAEDGDFDRKVKEIEAVDGLVPRLIALDPDVLVVTGDHSTPSSMASHSWHPVPLLIRAANARVDDVTAFDEISCMKGALGLQRGFHLMALALAHAGRLAKYGA